MLDAFKKLGGSQARAAAAQADELEALIATSREERAALSTMLTQIQLQTARLAGAGKALQEVDAQAAQAHARLDDVRINMEELGEHRTVLDHVMATCTQLGEMVREAQSTLRALQTERELAERIERGNKQLRARTSAKDRRKPA